LLRRLPEHRFHEGVADSLQRLKRAAEDRARQREVLS
jgi:hypothetical protein